MKEGAFKGIKIADFSWVAVGPSIVSYFANHGAEVIHIESDTRPDVLRVTSPFKDNKPGINTSGYWANYNISKYGLSLNLNHPRSKEVTKRLIKWADVVVESFAPGAMAKWGLDYKSLLKVKPDIIMLSTCMQGQIGPYASIPGVGVQLASLAGLTIHCGWPDREPAAIFTAYTDPIATPFGVSALAAALDYRRRTGKGQFLDLSQLETGVQFLSPILLDSAVNGSKTPRMGNRSPCAAPHGVYPCQGNDSWCALAIFNDREWRNFCRIIGEPEWTKDPKFATLLNRKEHEDELDTLVASWTINLKSNAVMDLLQSSGVSAGMVENGKDLHNDPQLKYRDHYWVLDHHEIGPHTYDAPPYKLSKTPANPSSPAPCMGEHNEYVCTQMLGMQDEEFIDLLSERVFE